MANDLATLNGYLDTKLRDTDDKAWTSSEKNNLLTWAVDMLFQDRPRSVREIVTLADDDDQYGLSSVYDVFRIDILDEDDKLLMPLPRGTWELWSDSQTASPTLYVNPRYAKTGWTLRVHGYAPYDLEAVSPEDYPPDRMVPLILATAAAEAARRKLGERARFEQWGTQAQQANVSVNELTQMVNEFDAERDRLKRELRIIQKPKLGRRT